MKVQDSFTLKHIDDTVRKIYSLPEENQLELKLNGYKDLEEVSVLEVKWEGVCQQYVLVKVSDKVHPSNKTFELSLLLEPKFVIKNQNQQSYGAFENLDGFKVVAPNQLNELQALLASLAECQALFLASLPQQNGERSLKKIIPTSSTLIFDNVGVVEAVDKLQDDFKRGMELDSLFVPSIWSYPSNSYINTKSNTVAFLKVHSQNIIVPPLFDALLYIFTLSDEKFRQSHFNQLVSHYYGHLEKSIKSFENHCGKLTRSYRETLMDALLPVVKLKLSVELTNDSTAQNKLQEITTNLEKYFQYPMLNKEDIYEIVYNKLSSENYDLLDYKLAPLSDANGHLGEYFHLIIKVRHENHIKEFNLFAKILTVFNETFKEVMEQGVGKKEDFFYNFLCPMYRKYGLDDLMDFSPRCYLSNLTKVVLDDLIHLGYESPPVNQELNVNDLKKVLSKLAKFHACTLIAEELRSKETGRTVRFRDDYSEFFQEPVFLRTGKVYKLISSMILSLKYCIDQDPSLTRELNLTQAELHNKFQEIIDTLFIKTQPSDKFRNVINHGDLYLGNMLFKYHNNGAIEDGMLVDFQVLRLLPPAYEVMFFTTVCGSKDVNQLHLNEVVSHYYEELSGHLERFNLDPEEIYSREHYDQDIKYAMSASKIAAMHYSQFTFIKPELRKEITHNAEKMKYYYEDNRLEFMDLVWKDPRFRERTIHLVKQIIDLIKDDNV